MKHTSDKKSFTSNRMKPKIIFAISCSVGCFVHLYFCCSDYFKYTTLTKVGDYVPKTQEIPRISLCFTFDLDNVDNQTFLDHKLKNDSKAFARKYAHFKVDSSKIINSCGFRNLTSQKMENVDCDSTFETEKSDRKYYDCYLLVPKKQQIYNLLEIVTSLSSRSLLYHFSLVKNMTKTGRVLPLVHFKTWPFEEFLYAIDMDTSLEKKQLYSLSYQLLEYFRLPYPYDTDCIESKPQCIRAGYRNGICSKLLCRENITLTYTSMMNEGVKDGIHFRVETLESPVIRIVHSFKIRPSSFFLELFSLLSLWLSLSAISLLGQAENLFHFITFSRYKKPKKKPHKNLFRLQAELMSICMNARINFTYFSNKVRQELMTTRQSKQYKMKFVQFLLNLIILALCSAQILSITIDYFSYRTIMRVNLILKSKASYPSLSHCVNMISVVNLSRPSDKLEGFDQRMTEFATKFNYTLEEHFNLSPPVEAFIIRCRVRHSVQSPLYSYDNCSEFFEVTKFWQDNYICYRMNPKFKYNLDPNKLRRNNHQPGVLFSIVINKRLASFNHFQPIVSNDYPHLSRFLSSRLFKQREKQLNLISSSTCAYKLLPPPYDTRCLMEYELSECYKNCLDLKKFNRVPYSQLYIKPESSYILNYVDMKNHTIANYISKREKKCDQICSFKCESDLTKTLQSYTYSSNEVLELALILPKYPKYKVEAVPVYTFYQLVYQMACILSFWFGFSLIKLKNLFSKSKIQRLYRQIYLSKIVDEMEKVVFHQPRWINLSNILIISRIKIRENIIQTIFFVLCSIGYSLHTLRVSSQYFQYPTLMDTRMGFEDNYTELMATICLPIEQLDLKGNFSIKNIFSKSPQVDEILLECGHRGFNLKELSHLPTILKQRLMPFINSSSLCNELFQIRKIIMLGMVCYPILPQKNSHNAEYEAKYHLIGSTVFQYFTIRYPLAKYNLTIAASFDLPTLSLFFSTQTQLIGQSQSHWYWVSKLKS